MVDFTRADCQYEMDGVVWTVNYDLAVKQGIDKEAVQKIMSLHQRRANINNLAAQEPIDSKQTALYRRVLTGFEYLLQRLWGFPADNRWHPHQRIGV